MTPLYIEHYFTPALAKKSCMGEKPVTTEIIVESTIAPGINALVPC